MVATCSDEDGEEVSVSVSNCLENFYHVYVLHFHGDLFWKYPDQEMVRYHYWAKGFLPMTAFLKEIFLDLSRDGCWEVVVHRFTYWIHVWQLFFALMNREFLCLTCYWGLCVDSRVQQRSAGVKRAAEKTVSEHQSRVEDLNSER